MVIYRYRSTVFCLSMEDQNTNQQSSEEENGKRIQGGANEEDVDEKVILLLDSTDAYLTLLDSLSSTLRQGWLELASARYSMGTSRVTSTLFDLKLHSAATTVQVSQVKGDSPSQDPVEKQPHFALCKWSCCSDESYWSRETDADEEVQKNDNASGLQHRGVFHFSGEVGKKHTTISESPMTPRTPRSPLIGDDHIQKERSKSLSVFGTLVSPKLRAAQISFETALETLVKAANMRSMMLSAHAQLQHNIDGKTE